MTSHPITHPDFVNHALLNPPTPWVRISRAANHGSLLHLHLLSHTHTHTDAVLPARLQDAAGHLEGDPQRLEDGGFILLLWCEHVLH